LKPNLENTYYLKGNAMLKYLFSAKYKDGEVYKQNEQDVSLTDEKRSCFFDVKQDEVESFHLHDYDHVYSVYLNDGRFSVDGLPFFMHDTGEGLKDFRLIFYRQHEHDFNVGGGMKEIDHRIKYCIGWQTNDANGNNIKRIMEVT
jgi:hypothetical protein